MQMQCTFLEVSRSVQRQVQTSSLSLDFFLASICFMAMAFLMLIFSCSVSVVLVYLSIFARWNPLMKPLASRGGAYLHKDQVKESVLYLSFCIIICCAIE